MMRFILQIFILFLLIIVQVSFIHALPFPFDRIPMVLIVTIYLYQYGSQTSIWWWLILYGFILDYLAISVAPLEMISYGFTAFTMTLLVAHVFTNRSFYGMAATALLSLFVLTICELFLIGVTQILISTNFSWQDVIFSQLWAMIFASFLLLFIFPFLRRLRFSIQKYILVHL